MGILSASWCSDKALGPALTMAERCIEILNPDLTYDNDSLASANYTAYLSLSGSTFIAKPT